jgi:hypothetical protein
MAVSRAVQSGRLKASVIRDVMGQPKIADPDLADREWEAGTDLTKAPAYVKERADNPPPTFVSELAPPRDPSRGGRPPGTAPAASAEGMTLSEASAAEKLWKARMAELQYREKAGELVNAKDVSMRLEGVFTTCRTRLLGVPSRARQAIPSLTVADITALEDLVREALEELAAGKLIAGPATDEQAA